jgi:hypothetical protein
VFQALPGSDYFSLTQAPAARMDAALFMDASTGSTWNFDGCAISGSLQGTCLKTVPALNDYWFDWRNYHPRTTIFKR